MGQIECLRHWNDVRAPSLYRYLQHRLVVGLVRQRGLDRGLGHRKGAPGLGNHWAVVGQREHGRVAAPWEDREDRGRRTWISKNQEGESRKEEIAPKSAVCVYPCAASRYARRCARDSVPGLQALTGTGGGCYRESARLKILDSQVFFGLGPLVQYPACPCSMPPYCPVG